jgi:formate/nitrite transporter
VDYVKPQEVCNAMIEVGAAKSKLGVGHLLIRGFLSGALLAYATTLAITATIQTTPIVGALVFPVGFVIIVLLGFELLTGNFAVVPVARLAGKTTTGRLFNNFCWVFIGNLLGSVVYGAFLYCTLPHNGQPAPLAEKLIAVAQAKTTGYAALGTEGMVAVFVKAILCNWMVTLGVVMALASSSTAGKIMGAWLPIFIFFAHGYEHLIVNFFLIPTGMMLGAKVTVMDWVLWNMIPVTIGNFIGGFVFTGLAFYLTHKKPAPVAESTPVNAPAAKPQLTPLAFSESAAQAG